MEVLITGCERSGTKMLAKHLGLDFNLENKHTISSFKYYQELQRWNKYITSEIPTQYSTKYEKHSLNNEINIDFLKWVKLTWPNIKIYYIVRDGRNVVSSIINKTWGHSQNIPNYKIDFYTACKQWQNVIFSTWEWAQSNCEIIRYENMCDVISSPLTQDQYKDATILLHKSLKQTQYI